MKYMIMAVFAFMFISSPVFSNEKLTLSDCISIALERNNSYKIAVEQKRENKEKINQAWGQLWPSFSTDVSASKMDTDASSNYKSDHQYAVNIVNATLSVNPGQFYNSLLAAKSSYEAAEANLRYVQLTTNKKTIDLFYAVVLAKEILKMREESKKSLLENYKTVQAGYNKGIYSKLQYLTARVNYSNADTDMINAKSDYDAAVDSLNIHLGNELDSSLDLDFNIDSFNSEEIDKVMSSGETEDRFVNRLIAEALKNRPELLQKKINKEIYDYNADYESDVYIWPSFFVNGKYSSTKTAYNSSGAALPVSTAPEENWINSWNITAGATYKWGALAPWDSAHAKSAQMDSKAKQAELDFEDFVKNVKLDVKKNYLKMKSARNSILSQQDNVVSAKENLRAASVQFKTGIIDNTNFLNANVDLIQAETLLIQAYNTYHTAKASLNTVVGVEIFKL